MFNVLPDTFKKDIKKVYRSRLLLVILLSVLFLQMSFLVFVAPSWISSFFKEKELQAQLESLSGTSSYRDLAEVSKTIESTNAKLKAVNSNLQYIEAVPLVKSLLASKTSGIYIDSIIYTSSTATSSIMSFAGRARSRESLIAFTETLKKSKIFSTVDLPISNLARDKDIDFSINLTVVK